MQASGVIVADLLAERAEHGAEDGAGQGDRGEDGQSMSQLLAVLFLKVVLGDTKEKRSKRGSSVGSLSTAPSTPANRHLRLTTHLLSTYPQLLVMLRAIVERASTAQMSAAATAADDNSGFVLLEAKIKGLDELATPLLGEEHTRKASAASLLSSPGFFLHRVLTLCFVLCKNSPTPAHVPAGEAGEGEAVPARVWDQSWREPLCRIIYLFREDPTARKHAKRLLAAVW